MVKRTRREEIIAEITRIIEDFLYYNRKEDEDLPPGEIEKAIAAEEISIDAITDEFRERLKENIS